MAARRSAELKYSDKLKHVEDELSGNLRKSNDRISVLENDLLTMKHEQSKKEAEWGRKQKAAEGWHKTLESSIKEMSSRKWVICSLKHMFTPCAMT